jgi:photosystem II stability/assembly factor-like uncharacterized protein
MAQRNPPILYVQDMTRGLRFEPPLMTIHFLQTQPNKIYIGNRFGRVYQSDDYGESWLEGTVLTPRNIFLGGSFGHRSAHFTSYGLLNEGILPSPGQLFSFQNLLDLNQRLPQAGGLVRSYFNQGFDGDLSVTANLATQSRHRASWRLYEQTRHKYRLNVGWRDPIASRLGQNIEVRSIATPSNKPQEIILGTGDGLYHSRDGGDSWPISYSGLNSLERSINIVLMNPHRPKEVWIGTQGGLRVSRDGGTTYQSISHRFVYDGNIQWVAFHPTNPDIIYVGLVWSMVSSKDGGESFGVSYYRSYPQLGNVRKIFVDPHRPNRILLGTLDGLMLSVNGGDKFTRSGGMFFVGQQIQDISQGFFPGHYFVATSKDLWQTFDGGETWHVAYFGSIDWYIRRLMLSPNRRELWVVTSAEILKLSYQSPRPVDPSKYRLLRDQFLHEPSMSDVVSEALKIAGVHRGDRAQMRSRARIGALLPNVDTFYVQRETPIDFALTNFLLKQAGEVTNENSGLFNYSVWGIFLRWDLRHLIYHTDGVPVGGREYKVRKLEEDIRELVISLCQERIALIAALTLNPREPRVTLMRRLRLEELTAHINALSGDLLVPYNAFETIQPSP